MNDKFTEQVDNENVSHGLWKCVLCENKIKPEDVKVNLEYVKFMRCNDVCCNGPVEFEKNQ